MKGVLNISNMNQRLVNVQYGLKNTIANQAKTIKEGFHLDKHKSAREVPHAISQTPLQPHFTFYRQVLSGILDPGLLKSDFYHGDVKKRIEFYLKELRYPLGAYSEDVGYYAVKQSISKFLEKRDGYPVSLDRIYLVDGVTIATDMALRILIDKSTDKILIPSPCAPFQQAMIPLFRGQTLTYPLNEEKGWTVDIYQMQKIFDENTKIGLNVKAIYVSNPSNPTGKVLTHEEMRQIVDFAHKNKLVILADEAFQDTIYKDGASFISFKKIICENKDTHVDLFSFYSASNALFGARGLRAGFFEAFSIDDEVNQEIRKLKSMYSCPNTVGQIMTDLITNPPSLENNSKEIVEQYNREKQSVVSSLLRKTKLTTEFLKNMRNISFNETEGGLFCFPRLHLCQKAVKEAESRNLDPDEFYVIEELALRHTNISLKPGNLFNQKQGTYHYRLSNLLASEEKLKQEMEELHKFNEYFQNKYN